MMQSKFFAVFITTIVCLGTFYGCTGLSKAPIEKKYFDLNINLPVANQYSFSKGSSLFVKEFFINSTFDSHSFVYRVGQNQYEIDYYNEFISYPAKLITQKIEGKLCASSHFISAQTNRKFDIDYRLSGKITKLYGDFQDPNMAKAIIEIRMILEKRKDNTFQTIIGNTYLAKEDIASSRPDYLVSGWNIGLAKIMTQFINDFETTTP